MSALQQLETAVRSEWVGIVLQMAVLGCGYPPGASGSSTYQEPVVPVAEFALLFQPA